MIPVGPWQPDQPALGGTGVREALNVIPDRRSYRPLRAPSPIGEAVPARVLGSAAPRGLNEALVNIAGTATALYRWDGIAWTDISRTTGGAYAVPDTGQWTFCQFGDRLIATDGVDAVQKFDITTDTEFEALAGSPPIARYCATVFDFVMLGNLAGAPNSVRWCAINNTENWVVGSAQADFQPIPEGGQVMGLVGGTVGLVFLERSVNRFAYAGPPVIFQRDEIARDIGAVTPGAITGLGNHAFFLAESGFQGVVGAAQVGAIGDGQIDQFFWDDLDQTHLHRISSAIDPVSNVYAVSYPSIASDGTPDRLLLYHWPTGQWARASVPMDRLHQLVSQVEYTLDSMGVFGPIDDLDFSFDSRFLVSDSRQLLACFNLAHRIAPFGGDTLEAIVETVEAQLIPGRVATVTGVRPIVEGVIANGLRVMLGSRYRTQDPVVYAADVAVNAEGIAPSRVTGRYHRARITVPAGSSWTHLLGVDSDPDHIFDAGSR